MSKQAFKYQITNEDCLELLKRLPDHSVDMVLCDPPYGHTNAKWDIGLNWEDIWAELKRVVKPNGAKLFFTSSFFHYQLVQSNFKEFKYRYIWAKSFATNFLNAKRMPLRQTEEICVFYSKQPHYEPRLIDGFVSARTNYDHGSKLWDCKYKQITFKEQNKRCTADLLNFKSQPTNNRLHISQKPNALLEHLIKTYTIEGETVLDFAMGSGSTGEACYHTNRRFIGCELSPDFFAIAKTRLELLPYPDKLKEFISTNPLKQLKIKAALNSSGGQIMNKKYIPLEQKDIQPKHKHLHYKNMPYGGGAKGVPIR